MEQKIEQDLKVALLAHDAFTVSTLRVVKSVLLNCKVELGKRESGLDDGEIIKLLAKEAKKRQEAAELYIQAGNQERSDSELAEKAIIEKYLPDQLSESELVKIVESVMQSTPSDKSAMGQIIGSVKVKAGPTADGALIAKLVKERLGD